MGLDQYAYAISSTGEEKELQTWRKHPNLQGFMEQLWEDKGKMCFNKDTLEETPFDPDKQGGSLGEFNCIPLALTAEDITNLEEVVKLNRLPITGGFFFGESHPDDKADDLEFIKLAKEAIAEGWTVVYNSWW